MKLFNALSGMNAVKPFIVAASGTVYAGDFVKLVSGYLTSCTADDFACIGRALGGGTQVASLPTLTAPNGSTPVDYSQQGYGSLVIVDVALAYPGVSYSVYALGVTSLANLTNNYALYIANASASVEAEPGLTASTVTIPNIPMVNLLDPSHGMLVVQDVPELCPSGVTTMKTPVPYDPTSTAYTNVTSSDVVYFQGKLYVAIAVVSTAGTSTTAPTVPGTAAGASYWQELPKVMVGIDPSHFSYGGISGGMCAPLAKTADYTLTASDWGQLFTTTGSSGTRTFTLPAPSAALNGMSATFINTVDANMVITGTAGKLVISDGTTGNAAAQSATFGTASKKIGAAATVYCDGTKWLFTLLTANTVTVA